MKIYHHYLVLKIDEEEKEVVIIHYSGDAKFSLTTLSVAAVRIETIPLFENSDNLNFDNGVYIIKRDGYPSTANEYDAALKRASSVLGETRYRAADNNCETFVTWVLTGIGECEQFDQSGSGRRALADSIDAGIKVGRKGPDVAFRVNNTVLTYLITKSGDKILEATVANALRETVKQTVKIGPAASAITAGVTTGITAAVAAPIEAIFCGLEIHELHKQKKSGRIDKKAFKRGVTKNIAGSASSVAAGTGGGFLGMFIGQLVIPLPIVGGLIGGAVGGIIGSVVGRVTGSAVSGKIFDEITDKKA